MRPAVVVAAWLALLACASRGVPGPGGQTVTLRVGQSTVVEGGLALSFDRVVGDSRCPAGAVCVWEGDGVLAVRLQRVSAPPGGAELHRNPRFAQRTTYAGFEIRLEALTPYPVVHAPIPPEAYRARLIVTPS